MSDDRPTTDDGLRAEIQRLREAILDIDAHAVGMGEDADGWVTGGYRISIGSLHRALGVIGHSAPKCNESLACERARAAEADMKEMTWLAVEARIRLHDRAEEVTRAESALREIYAQAEVARDLDEFVAFVLHHVECIAAAAAALQEPQP